MKDFQQMYKALSKERKAANLAVKELIMEAYPEGSRVRYVRNGSGPIKIGVVLNHPCDWVLDDRIRIENEATGKCSNIEPKHIISLA